MLVYQPENGDFSWRFSRKKIGDLVEIYPLVILCFFFHGILMECDGIIIHFLWDIPSGKHTRNDGKIHHV